MSSAMPRKNRALPRGFSSPSARGRGAWSLAAATSVMLLVACSACDDEPAPLPTPLPSGSAAARAQAGDPTLPQELEPKPSSSVPEDAGGSDAPWEGPWFVVTRIAAAVYSEPVFDRKKKLGYVRSGGRIPVKQDPVSKHNCSSGWYQVVSGGFICGNLGTTNLSHPKVKFATKQPDLDEVLPYTYARNAKHGTPLYKSVPSREQMYQYEPYLPGAKAPRAKEPKPEPTPVASSSAAAPDAGSPPPASSAATTTGASDAIGAALADAGVLVEPADAGDEPQTPWWQQENADERLSDLKIEDLAAGADDVLAKRMVKGFYVAIDKTFRWNNRTWYKTTKGLVAPADRFWQVAGSKFKGVELDGTEWKLPVAWVYGGRKRTTTYELDEDTSKLKPAGTIKRFHAVALTGKTQKVRKRTYWQTKDGLWIKDSHVRVTSPADPPEDLQPQERWIDVNVSQQTLVLFDGTRPIYATLISTGKKSTIKEKDHRTKVGEWRVREKHITTTMDGDGTAAGDLPYSIEDVPYVMYYHRSYAVHGAFWHRNFGVRMSHGCINLAPLDAKHLFFATEPRLPEGWHGVWASPEHPGSRVIVHE